MSDLGSDLDVGIVPTQTNIKGASLQEKDIMNAMDNVLIQLHDTGDISIADGALSTLLNLQHVSGRASAKLLWGMQEWWKSTNQAEETGDTFEDYMMDQHKLKKVRLRRYIRVWEYTQNDELPKAIQSRPMKDQIAICSMLSQGHDPSKEQWKKLEKAIDNNEVLAIIRKIKKEPARKGSMQLSLERDGTINAWVDDKKVFVGYLNVKGESENNPVLSKAIERIVSSTGMNRK